MQDIKDKKNIIKFGDSACYVNNLFSLRTNLADFYFNTEDCQYCYITEEGKAIGYVQFTISKTVIEILVINAKTEEMKKSLLLAVVDFAEENRLSVEWRIISEVVGDNPSNKDFETAESLGFNKGNVLHIFKSFRDVYDNLSKIVKLFERLSEMMAKRGFTLSSFQNLSDDARKYICENTEGEFAEYLQSGKYIKGGAGRFNEDISYVALYDGKPVAYTVVRTPTEKHCIFENNSVANSFKNSGVLAMVWGASLKDLLNSDYESITFAVYEENGEAYPMVKKRLASIISQEILQINYFRFYNMDEDTDLLKSENGEK